MGNRMHSLSNSHHASALLSQKSAPFIPILPFPSPYDLRALYNLGPELGRGQFGIIRSCTCRSSGSLFACKSISKLTCNVEDAVREVCILKRLSNHNIALASQTRCTDRFPSSGIVRLHDVIEDDAFVHVIMELCCGGDLFNSIRKKRCYSEAPAAFLMRSLLETVQCCHTMGIMHRDIKPENILLLVEDSETSGIKLTDFGLALEFTPGQKFCGMAGSSYYIAPEVLLGEYSEEVDMWSSGVILYILLSGVPPFCGATEQRIFNAIKKGELSFPSSPWDEISASAKDMITQMLHPDAKSRLTPAEALKHPWIVHHTRNAKHIQLIVPASVRPSSTMHAGQHQSAGNSSSYTSLSAPCKPTSAWARATTLTDAAKPELTKVLGDLVTGLSRNALSISEALATQSLRRGWACTVLSISAEEEAVVVDMGQDLEKYLVSHDRIRKRIGWKLVKDKSAFTKPH